MNGSWFILKLINNPWQEYLDTWSNSSVSSNLMISLSSFDETLFPVCDILHNSSLTICQCLFNLFILLDFPKKNILNLSSCHDQLIWQSWLWFLLAASRLSVSRVGELIMKTSLVRLEWVNEPRGTDGEAGSKQPVTFDNLADITKMKCLTTVFTVKHLQIFLGNLWKWYSDNFQTSMEIFRQSSKNCLKLCN